MDTIRITITRPGQPDVGIVQTFEPGTRPDTPWIEDIIRYAARAAARRAYGPPPDGWLRPEDFQYISAETPWRPGTLTPRGNDIQFGADAIQIGTMPRRNGRNAIYQRFRDQFIDGQLFDRAILDEALGTATQPAETRRSARTTHDHWVRDAEA